LIEGIKDSSILNEVFYHPCAALYEEAGETARGQCDALGITEITPAVPDISSSATFRMKSSTVSIFNNRDCVGEVSEFPLHIAGAA
jgi:hypothetical protein